MILEDPPENQGKDPHNCKKGSSRILVRFRRYDPRGSPWKPRKGCPRDPCDNRIYSVEYHNFNEIWYKVEPYHPCMSRGIQSLQTEKVTQSWFWMTFAASFPVKCLNVNMHSSLYIILHLYYTKIGEISQWTIDFLYIEKFMDSIEWIANDVLSLVWIMMIKIIHDKYTWCTHIR
jgi:hypothetical protein